MRSLSAAAFAGLALLLLSPAATRADGPKVRTITVDVAEDFSKFVPTFVNAGDGEPKVGSFFLTQGRLFPAGTIQGDGSTFDPNSAGSIGEWLCRGTHLADASKIISGEAPIWVMTTQQYLLPGDDRSISTEGREGSAPILRAVIGGTGVFRGVVGEQRQELLGFNATGGVNLRVTFTLRSPN